MVMVLAFVPSDAKQSRSRKLTSNLGFSAWTEKDERAEDFSFDFLFLG